MEEVQASMGVRHLSQSDQAIILFDHLEGEARDEIEYRSAAERENPARIFIMVLRLLCCTA